MLEPSWVRACANSPSVAAAPGTRGFASYPPLPLFSQPGHLSSRSCPGLLPPLAQPRGRPILLWAPRVTSKAGGAPAAPWAPSWSPRCPGGTGSSAPMQFPGDREQSSGGLWLANRDILLSCCKLVPPEPSPQSSPSAYPNLHAATFPKRSRPRAVHGFHFPKQTRAPCLPARGRPSPAASLTWPRQRDGFPLRAPRWEQDPTWQRKRGQRRPPGSQAGAGGSLRQPIW